ncbi:hypothetical protein ACS0Y6_02510 [Burkholderia gladioli]|uniref:hypothetical protein n=1 Tax=Burkholderia gladioli TaxID=28095 RepID=UPI003F79CA97
MSVFGIQGERIRDRAAACIEDRIDAGIELLRRTTIKVPRRSKVFQSAFIGGPDVNPS